MSLSDKTIANSDRFELESSRALFQPPRYRVTDGTNRSWSDNFVDLSKSQSRLSWDLASVMSTLSLGYALGNRTLFNEISRQPWMSKAHPNGDVEEMPVPPHGRKWMDPAAAAEELLRRLEDELVSVCKRFSEVTLLLSGGLDSRIVAGVLRRLIDSGRMENKVQAVTWGPSDSRDVALAKETANRLQFSWHHLELGPSQVGTNINMCAARLGATVSPIHLHRMDWLVDHASEDSVVLAASYGDSVGRSEYSRRTVLELSPLQPYNYLGLLDRRFVPAAETQYRDELQKLQNRVGDQPQYVYCEHQQQCHYMRGVIAQTMSVINQRTPVYQAFTSPNVFGFIWGLHPAARTDKIYRILMERIGYSIVSIPWARSNVSPDGTRRDRNKLRAVNHDYPAWVRSHIRSRVDAQGEEVLLESFSKLSFLNSARLRWLLSSIQSPDTSFAALGHQPYGVWMWLESLAQFVDSLGDRVLALPTGDQTDERGSDLPMLNRSSFRTLVSSIPWARSIATRVRGYCVRRLSLIRYPVEN